MNKKDIRDLSLDDLADYAVSCGAKVFNASQIFEWIYKKGVRDFSAMTNLSASLRERLAEDFCFPETSAHRDIVSEDGTRKFLFELEDKEKIETVLIPALKRATVCVSTQAGCKFACKFCASGIGGWKRNLTCAEILNQILYAQKISSGHPVSHVVFMGTGEPLDNYENVMKSIRIINSPYGMSIAARRITISTCGLIPQMKKLAQEHLQAELAISLHGFDEESRRVFMPVSKTYPLKDLISACREYIRLTKRQITFEYILIKDFTCSEKAAQALGKLLAGMTCKMNLIPYNKVEGFPYEPPAPQEISAFKQALMNRNIHAIIRTPRGQDVSAACGQLRHGAV